MAEIGDYARNRLIDFLFRGQALSPPATMYAALFTTAPNHAIGSGTEVSGGSYARVAVVSSLANWAGTQGSGSTTVSSGSGSSAVTSNNGSITFPAPSVTWGTVTGWALFDASTGGNMWFFGALAVNKTVNAGDAAPSFATGAFSLVFDT
jgi:hypothetical protein